MAQKKEKKIMNHPETHGKKKEKRGDKGPIYKSILHIFFSYCFIKQCQFLTVSLFLVSLVQVRNPSMIVYVFLYQLYSNDNHFHQHHKGSFLINLLVINNSNIDRLWIIIWVALKLLPKSPSLVVFQDLI